MTNSMNDKAATERKLEKFPILRHKRRLARQFGIIFLFLTGLLHLPIMMQAKRYAINWWAGIFSQTIAEINAYSLTALVCFMLLAAYLIIPILVRGIREQPYRLVFAVVVALIPAIYLMFDLTIPWRGWDGGASFVAFYLLVFFVWGSRENTRLVRALRLDMTGETTRGLDDPAANIGEDRLNRAPFAKSIFSIIQTLPEKDVRLMLTGEWGWGKTTCLNFIADYARKNDYPVVIYNPWRFSNKTEAWKGFVSALDEGLARWKGQGYKCFRRNNIFFSLTKIVTDGLGIVTDGMTAHKFVSLFNELILKRTEPFFSDTKEKVGRVLCDILGKKRLIILIDDLDRAPNEIVYSTLLHIKEVIDIQGCVYVCGIDINSTIRTLEQSGVIDPRIFIEKIFQHNFDVPAPSAEDRRALLKDALSKLNPRVKEDLIEKNEGVLPRNPRKLKAYLRTISALDGILLNRFGKDDLMWEFLYLVELAKIKHPSEIEALKTESLFFEWISESMLYKHDGLGDTSNAKKLKAWKTSCFDKLKNNNQNKDNELESLMELLAETAYGMKKEKIQAYFNILALVEPLTWKEYREWRAEPREEILNRLVGKENTLPRRREYLLVLMRDRHRLLSLAADEYEREDCERLVKKADDLTDECFWYLDKKEIVTASAALINPQLICEW